MEFREQRGAISFEEAERRHAELKRRYDVGLIGDEQFDAERQRLVVRDDQGRSWAMSRESGRWLYHDGNNAWIEATPPGLHRRGAPERLEPLERTESRGAGERHCANCGAVVGPQATFCVSCGEHLVPEAGAYPVSEMAPGRPGRSNRNGLLIGLGVLVAVLVLGLIAALAYPLVAGEETAAVSPSRSSSETSPSGANVDRFVGVWENENPQSEGITRVEITSRLGELHVQMWGSCEPTDCDWGTESTDVSDSDDGTLSISWRPGFKVETQELTLPSDGRLQVVGHTRFTDDSGRPDYDSTHYFTRTTEEAEQEAGSSAYAEDTMTMSEDPPPEEDGSQETPSSNSPSDSPTDETAAAEDAIRGHYEAIGEGDFETAYSYFGPTSRANVDEQDWIDEEETFQITGSTINSVEVEEVSGETATAAVDVSFEDNTGTPRFVITWNLIKEGEEWKLDSQESAKSTT